MKFRPPVMIRYWIRWLSLAEFVVLPLFLFVWIIPMTAPDEHGYAFLMLFLILVACLLVENIFLEKHFAVLHITQTEIIWRCPFRRSRIMRIEECLEVGSYLENKDNGIPKEMIYFSDHKRAQWEIIKKGINKGVLPASKHVIKYWYSEELHRYVSNEFLKIKAKERRVYCFSPKRGE